MSGASRPTSRTTASAWCASRPSTSSAPREDLVTKLLRCSTPSTSLAPTSARATAVADEGKALAGRLDAARRHAQPRGPRAHRRPPASPSTPPSTTRSSTSATTRPPPTRPPPTRPPPTRPPPTLPRTPASAATGVSAPIPPRGPSSTRCCAPGTGGRDGCIRPGHGAGAGVMAAPSASGSRRTTTRCSGVATTATDKEITRAYRKLAKQFHPDANPGPRTASRRSPPPTTCSATPPSARSTTRCGASARPASAARWAGLRRTGGHDVPGRGPRRPRRPLRRAGRRLRRRRRPAQPHRGPAARRRRRGRAAPVLRGRRARRHHVGERGERGALSRPATGTGAAPGSSPVTCPTLPRPGVARRQPGPVLARAACARSARGAAPSSRRRARPATARA